LMVGIIAAVAWPPMARGIRGLILQLKSSGYVEAARSLGGSPIHALWRHMLPLLLPFILSQLAAAAPIFLLGELTLSFLNIGFRDSGESWGSMMRSLKDTRVLTDFWWNLLPLCMVFLALLCLNLLGNQADKGKKNHQALRL
jgi:ABC-type dipeptide/oligopeptide/nickel transport system permease subunit